MSKEYKSISFTNLKAESDGRKRAGIAAVFGNVDSAGDRIHAGAFLKTIQENLSRVKFLWNHNAWGQAITTAKIISLEEVSRDSLPEEVRQKAPEATGGLKVVREYYDDDESKKILARIDAGDIDEMSFAYDVVKYEITQEDTGLDDMPKRRIRELKELKLFDVSDVLWGCNSATVASGAKNGEILPLGLIYSNLALIHEQVKAGRRNSDSDQKLVDLIHQTAVDLGAACSEEEPKSKTEETENKEEKAEAVSDTSLDSLGLRLRALEIENLTLEN